MVFLPNCTTVDDSGPSAIVQRYKVRPVLRAEEHPSGRELMDLFSADGKRVSDLYPHIENIPSNSLVTSFRSLRYILGAVSYHCERLAVLYADTWHSFHSIRPVLSEESNAINFAQYGFQEQCYYEFDALLTVIIRSYETMRFPLWNAFGAKNGLSGGGPRKNFEETLKACKHLPLDLVDRLGFSWVNFGIKAKAYRDFINHYFPLDRGFSYAKLEKLDDAVWSVSMFVPDNPEDKSPRNFRFDSKTDALSYGWELTNEIVQIAELLAIEIHKVYNAKTNNSLP